MCPALLRVLAAPLPLRLSRRSWSRCLLQTLKAGEAEANPLGRGELSQLVLLLSHLCVESIFSLRVPGSLLLQDVHAALAGGRHF